MFDVVDVEAKGLEARLFSRQTIFLQRNTQTAVGHARQSGKKEPLIEANLRVATELLIRWSRAVSSAVPGRGPRRLSEGS